MEMVYSKIRRGTGLKIPNGLVKHRNARIIKDEKRV
jgi:hypothetical protein